MIGKRATFEKLSEHSIYLFYFQLEGNKLRPDKYDWIEGDERVPEGWKIRYMVSQKDSRLLQ